MDILEKKRNAVKQLVFNFEGISRNQIRDRLNLDTRTITRYLDELTDCGFLRTLPVRSNGPGRPTILFYPNHENILFPGLFISPSNIRGQIVDINGNEVLDIEIDVTLANESKLSFFNKIIEQCSQLVNKIKISGKNVGGIGISCSRWLKPPLSEYEIYSYIFDAITEKFKLPVYKETPINALLYKIKNANLYEDNIAIIHPGHILEVGIMCNNIIPGNISDIEHKFQHFPVNPAGNRCYCGQIGCLENEVAKANILADYNNIPGVEKIDDIDTFFKHAANGRKHATAILETWGKVMAQGLLSLQHEHHLTKIYFCTTHNSLFFNETKKQLEKIISGQFILEEFPINSKSEPKAAGNMASYLTIKHYNLIGAEQKGGNMG